MTFHLIAYYESVDSSTLNDLTPAVDVSVAVSGDDVFVPDVTPYLAGYLVLGANLTQAQIKAPSMLENGTYIDSENNDVDAEPLSPCNYQDLWTNPKKLKATEGIRIAGAEDGAGATIMKGCVILNDGKNTEYHSGSEFTLLGTATTTLTAAAWSTLSVTWSQTLPSGEYAVVGMRTQSATNLFSRIVSTQADRTSRAGCIGTDADSDIQHPRFRHGNMGIWTTFNARIPPNIEMFAISADTAERVWLDLVKIK